MASGINNAYWLTINQASTLSITGATTVNLGSQSFWIGQNYTVPNGSGTLTVAAGGTLTINGGSTYGFNVGYSSTGTVNVTGALSVSATTPFQIANSADASNPATGTINLNSGGTLVSASAILGPTGTNSDVASFARCCVIKTET